MSRRTPGAGAALALLAAFATWVSLFAWRGFVVEPSAYLMPAAGGIAAVALTGMLARAARMPAVVVVAGQVLVVMLAGNLAWGSSVLPRPESLRTAVLAVRTAVESSQAYAAPVPPEAPSLVPLLVLGALLLHVLVDLLAVTLGRVPVAGLPLLTIYSLPVSVLQGGVGWVVFTLAAACFLGMLALQERTRVSRWGRPVAAPGPLSPHQAGGVGMAVAAIVTALLVPFVVPTFDLGLLDRIGAGTGSGNDGEVRIENPMTDLKRDLVLGPDVPLLQVSTASDRAPSYLRIAVLTAFTGQAWTPGDRDLPEANAANGELPWPIGLDRDVPHREQPMQLAATEALDSKWLPAPRFVSAVDTGGDEWRYDDDVLDFHARDDDVSTALQTWAAVELDLDLAAGELDAAGSASLPMLRAHTALPDGMPRSVVELAESVTAGAQSDYEKAVMLQRFFQDGFTYDVSRQPGNGTDALVQFLSEGDRRGYCEQFASAMAVMLRAVDVPARVSVGLLRPELVDRARGVYEFSTRDMHAWPEVHLDGYGWVMFEPTPTSHTESLPDYSRGVRPEQEPTDPSTSREPSASASPSVSPRVSPSASPSAVAPEDAGAGAGRDGGFPWAVLLWVLGAVLLLLALALLPHLLRSRRSERRWHGHLPPAEAAWTELRDRVVDLGLAWPVGRSPRRTAEVLSDQLAAPRTPDTPQRPAKGAHVAPEAAEALHALAGALEETRYAPPGAAHHDVDELRARVETVGASLEAGATPARRRTARWLPRSLVRRSSAAPEADELVDSIH
jgi:hypothetical protein